MTHRNPTYQDCFPMQSWKGQVFNFQNETIFLVDEAVAALNLDPSNFQFGMVRLSDLSAQIDGRGHYDPNRLANYTQQDASRPLLIATLPDGEARLIDGYHRAKVMRDKGAMGMPAIVLTPAQTERFSRPFLPSDAEI